MVCRLILDGALRGNPACVIPSEWNASYAVVSITLVQNIRQAT